MMHTLQLTLITDYTGTAQEITLLTSNVDVLRWEKTRGAKGYPQQTDAPALFSTFLAWSALARSGEEVGTFEQFETTVYDIHAEQVEVNPTMRATSAA